MARLRAAAARGSVFIALWVGASACTDLSLCSEGLCATDAPSMTDTGGAGGTSTSGSSYGGGGGGSTISTSSGGSNSTGTGGSASSSTSATTSTGGGGSAPTTASIVVAQPNGTPIAKVDVVVNDAGGAIVLRLVTDEDGRVTVSIPEGGSATVYRTGPSSEPRPLTIVSPPDGASIRVPMVLPDPVLPGGTAIDVAAMGVPIQPADLTFFGSCDAKKMTPATLDFTCAQASRHPASEAIVAVASTLLGVPAAWGSALDLAVIPEQSIDVELAVVREDFASILATMTHVALAATHAEIELSSLASPFGEWGPIVSHKKVWDDPVGDLSFTAKVPAVSWGFLLKEKLAVAVGPASRELWRERRWLTLPSESELSGNSMPELTLAPLDMSSSTHPRLDWEIGPVPYGEITVVAMDFGEAKATVRWTAWLAPDASGTFRLPEVPPDLKPPALAAAFPPVLSTVASADLDGVDSYAEALSTGAAAWVLERGENAGSFTATAGVLKSVP